SGTFRIAIVGDFSGRSGGTAPRAPSAPRAWRIDRDDLDTVLARIAPTLEIALDPGEPPLSVSFASLDDFHPDRLLARVPLFQRLSALRDEARATPPARPAPPPRRAERPDAVALDLTSGSLLDQIVGGATESAATRQAAPADDLSDFVARAV